MSKLIYIVFKNADQTEGRGPMMAVEAFEFREHAYNYISSVTKNDASSEIKQGWWDIREFVLHSEEFKKEDTERQKALSKLTERERELLGL